MSSLVLPCNQNVNLNYEKTKYFQELVVNDEKNSQWINELVSRMQINFDFNIFNIFSTEIEKIKKEKKSVKNLLKKFDKEFSSKYKRAPTVEEKEFLRPVYTFYNLLKEVLSLKEEALDKCSAANAYSFEYEDIEEIKSKLNEMIKKQIRVKQRLNDYKEDLLQDIKRDIVCKEFIEDIYDDFEIYCHNQMIIKNLENDIQKMLKERHNF